MPELPEVENVVRSLAPHLTGKRIEAAIHWKGPAIGQSIRRLHRHGKFIVFELERGFLLVHLRMTGKLLWNGARTPYTRVEFSLHDGSHLLFDDVRRFGRITFAKSLPALGPDPLEIPGTDFVQLMRARRGSIKPLLLNQKFLRGVGNIYADEALFRAGIHPRAVASRLSRERVLRLWAHLRELLDEAILRGGSSISDYVDGSGQSGSFQNFHQVYQRTGEPCVRCQSPIRRIVIGQRGTHFCPRCQR